MKKLSYDYVKQYFKDQGCELLSTKYIGNSNLMDYVCNCGNKYKINFNNFKNGKRCKQCGIEKMQESQKKPFKEVKQYFEDYGCKLLSIEYVNYNIVLDYICNCGNKSKICFANFKNGKRCAKCSGTERLKYDYVKRYFKDQGCELLSTKYTNNRILMDYICNCGNKSKISFVSFKRGRRCNQCGIEKCRESRKTPFEEVKRYFKDQGCELLSTEYIKNNILLDYICNCGNRSKISFCDFKNGSRCNTCKPRSKGEVEIYQLFDLKEIKYNTEVAIKEIGNKRYDFQVNNSFIEYHGKQHYCPFGFGSKEKHAGHKNLLNCIKNDQIKIDYCKNNKIPLLIIPFWEFSRIESIIEKFLNGEKVEISEPPKIVLKSNELRQHIRDYLKIESNEFLGGIINGEKY